MKIEAYLIDPKTRRITEIEYHGREGELASIVGADRVTSTIVNKYGDTLYTDDEGLWKRPQWFFKIKDHRSREHVLPGKAVALGSDSYGDTVDPIASRSWFISHVVWSDVEFSHTDEIRGVMTHPVHGPNTEYVEKRHVFVPKKKGRKKDDKQE